MDLNLIKPFLAVYQYQSITKAANALDLTQPAVSASLRRLETLLGKKLFIKQGRGITPTSAASNLANKFESAIELIENAVIEKQEFNAYCLGSVMHLLAPIEDLVLHEAPMDEDLLLQQLRMQKIDLVIDSMIAEDHSFIVEPIYAEEVVAVCRQGHPRIDASSNDGVLTAQDFYSEGHIYYQLKRKNLNVFEFKTDASQARDIRCSVSSLGSVLMTAASSDFIGSCSRGLAELWAERLQLQIYNYPIKVSKVPVHLVYHRRFINDPAHKAIRERVKANLSSSIHK